MRALELVDRLYAKLVASIDEPLRAHALSLPHTLRLAPNESARWSDVFAHEVTLAAPSLFAEAMPSVGSQQVGDAVLAHALAVIGAFGCDRIVDQQVAATSELNAVLAFVAVARDHAMERVLGKPSLDFTQANARALGAMKVERLLLQHGQPASDATYKAISIAKQAPGFPASIALARSAGWSRQEREDVRRTLEDIALALQLYDDVVDWEKDAAAGGAWAVSLARFSGSERVLASGVLARMLVRASDHFACAAVRASGLGAQRLADWCLERGAKLTSLAEAEVRSAGYAVRAHTLAPLALA